MNENILKSCCVTGHRDIPDNQVQTISAELRKHVTEAINDGYRHFISGFAPGADMLFARLVIELQTQYPHITLEAALPYGKWMHKRSKEDWEILKKCVCIGMHSPKYHSNCFLIRNRFMVNTCDRVIAVYDGREKGGTVSTMRYAHVLERDLRVINYPS